MIRQTMSMTGGLGLRHLPNLIRKVVQSSPPQNPIESSQFEIKYLRSQDPNSEIYTSQMHSSSTPTSRCIWVYFHSVYKKNQNLSPYNCRLYLSSTQRLFALVLIIIYITIYILMQNITQYSVITSIMQIYR